MAHLQTSSRSSIRTASVSMSSDNPLPFMTPGVKYPPADMTRDILNVSVRPLPSDVHPSEYWVALM